MATLASSGDAPQTSLSVQVEPARPCGSPTRERPRRRKCGPRWPTGAFQRARHPHPNGGRLNAAPVTVPAQPAGPHGRPGPAGHRRRRVHHEGSWRRVRRTQPGGPRPARHETLQHGRGEGHPARPGACAREPARLRLLAPALDKLDQIGRLPDDITVHLDAGYDSGKVRVELTARGMTGEIARKRRQSPDPARAALACRAD